jgi:hypothetical protein
MATHPPLGDYSLLLGFTRSRSNPAFVTATPGHELMM